MTKTDQVRIVAWNTARAGRLKLPKLVDRICPNVAVLSEYEHHPAVLQTTLGSGQEPRSFISAGVDGQYGLVVATWGEWHATRIDVEVLDAQLLELVQIDGPFPFQLLAVWAWQTDTRPHPVGVALDTWANELGDELVVAGDFNSGLQWTMPDKKRDHRGVVEALGTAACPRCRPALGRAVSRRRTRRTFGNGARSRPSSSITSSPRPGGNSATSKSGGPKNGWTPATTCPLRPT